MLGALVLILLCAGASSAASAQTIGPCSASGTAGVRFDGLRGRALVGDEQHFYIEPAAGLTLVGRFSVVMTDQHGRAFSHVRPDDSDELFLRLDWPDRFAVVAVTGIVGSPETGAQCTASASKRVVAVRRAFFPSRCNDTAYKPRSVVVACGDGNFQLRRMRWRGWNRRLVTGKGRGLYNDCDPYCAHGHFHTVPIRVRLGSRRYCANVGRYVYTRLKWRYGRRGPGLNGRLTGSTTFPCAIYDIG